MDTAGASIYSVLYYWFGKKEGTPKKPRLNMAKYYSIDKGSVMIKPTGFMAPIGWALIALFVLMPITIILIMVKGHLQQIEAKYFASYFMMFPFLLACIPLFTYSRRQVIFDAYQQTIYLKTIFSQKALMTFC
jgi:hypothetical protein